MTYKSLCSSTTLHFEDPNFQQHAFSALLVGPGPARQSTASNAQDGHLLSSYRRTHLLVAVLCFRQPARGRLPAPWQGSRAPSPLRCACRSGRRPGPQSVQTPPGSAAALQESRAHAVRSIGPARRLLIGASPGWQGTDAQGAHAQHAPEPGPADSGDCDMLLPRRGPRENSAAHPQPRPSLPCATAGECGRASASTNMIADGEASRRCCSTAALTLKSRACRACSAPSAHTVSASIRARLHIGM